eukprot:g8741.t1
MRLNLKKLKEGINIKTASLKSVKKKLKQVTKENDKKQTELIELKKRYAETLLKLQIGTEEAQILSNEVAKLKSTTGDGTVVELQKLSHSIIKQYVEEVRDDILTRKYQAFKGDLYDRTLFNEDDVGDSGEDELPVSAKDVEVPHLEDNNLNIGVGKKDSDGDEGHTLSRGLGDDDEKEGADLPFFDGELESKHSDDEDNGEENPQGDSKDNNNSNTDIQLPDINSEYLHKKKDAEEILKEEIIGGEKWLQKRHTKQIKYLKNVKQVEAKEVVVLYSEPDGIGGDSVYQCVIRVQDGATFHDIIDEACAHWGLMPEYTFLEDNVSRTIWPGNAVVADEMPLERIRPELHLVFVQNLKLNELVILTKKDQDRKDKLEKLHEANNIANEDESKVNHESEDGDDKSNTNGSASGPNGEGIKLIKGDDGEYIHSKMLYADPNTLPGGMANVMEKAPKRMFQYKTTKVIRDFILYALFMILLNVSLLYRRDIDQNYWLLYAARHNIARTSFVFPVTEVQPELDETGSFTGGYTSSTRYERLKFEGISSADHTWKWLEGPVSRMFHENKTGYLSGGNTQVVGKVRLRQLRVKPNVGCYINNLAADFVDACYATFAESSQSVDSYHDNQSPGFVWIQGSDLKGGGQDWSGELGSYKSGGFVLDIDPSRKSFPTAIKKLKQGLWIDHQTRLVELSYNVYNPNYNAYASAYYRIEFSNSGRVLSSYRVRAFTLDLCFFCDGFFAAEMALYFVFSLIVAIEASELNFFSKLHRCSSLTMRSIWHVHHVLVFTFFLTSIVSRFYTYGVAADEIKRLWSEELQKTFVDMSGYAYIYELAFSFEAFVVFFSSLRIFKFLSTIKSMNQFTAVFVRAGLEIIFFTMLFSATFFGFGVLAQNIYGASIGDFSTLSLTFKTLLKMTVGLINYEEMRLTDPVWTPIFFTVYIVFVSMILVNVFLAILNTSYTSVREETTAEDRRLKRLNAFKPESQNIKKDWKHAVFKIIWLPYAFNYQEMFIHPKILHEVELMKHKSDNSGTHAWQI